MIIPFKPLLIASTILLTGCTPENNALNLPPGKYQNDVKSTTENGVTTEKVDTTNVSEDAQGRKTAIIQSKTTEKPPGFFNGLFNKTTTNQSTEVMEEK